ncbi:hypothetical protein [Actinomycetospora atypica]|uniref:Uncharacterized protein n=1 Tax=Actinomycetospora atypica TaxID=1290095 RepID=A0ABV9YSL0_9PSEU
MDHGAAPGHPSLVALRAAAEDVRALDAPSSGSPDPMVHADRFEALHDALAAALADVGDGARPSSVDPVRG